MNYPANIGNDVAAGEHYMMINSYESLNAVNTGATMKSSIALYIPPQSMTTTIAQNYAPLEGGARGLEPPASNAADGVAEELLYIWIDYASVDQDDLSELSNPNPKPNPNRGHELAARGAPRRGA